MIKNVLDFMNLEDAEVFNYSGRFIYYIMMDKEVIYIGKTINISSRILDHFSCMRNQFNNVKIFSVSDEASMNDAEFIQILTYKPKRNLTLPRPSFFIIRSQLDKMISNDLLLGKTNTIDCYNIDQPDYIFTLNKRKFHYWLHIEKQEIKNRLDDLFKKIVALTSEKESDLGEYVGAVIDDIR